MTGIFSIEEQGSEANLVDFLLSCRVMGRKVEETLIYIATDLTSKLSSQRLNVIYKPTERNIPTLNVLSESDLDNSGPHDFFWDCANKYPKPPSVTIEYK